MPRKSSSKTPLQKAEKKDKEEVDILEQKKPSTTPEKAGNEIDEIFAGKKRKKPEKKKADKGNGDGISKPKSVKKKDKKNIKIKEVDGEELNEPSSRPRKRTADGFAIYSEEELGFNKSNAGSTPLCPFDCDCCF